MILNELFVLIINENSSYEYIVENVIIFLK